MAGDDHIDDYRVRGVEGMTVHLNREEGGFSTALEHKAFAGATLLLNGEPCDAAYQSKLQTALAANCADQRAVLSLNQKFNSGQPISINNSAIRIDYPTGMTQVTAHRIFENALQAAAENIKAEDLGLAREVKPGPLEKFQAAVQADLASGLGFTDAQLRVVSHAINANIHLLTASRGREGQ